MRKLFFTMLVVVTGLFISCGNKNEKADVQASEDVVTEEKKQQEENMTKEFLTTLYNDHVYGTKDFEKIKNHFSEKVLNRLRNEFEYDGEGYAVWLFRSGAQDGPSPICQVNSIEKGDDGWYTVSYSDMGYDGKCRFLIEIRDNEVFVLDFEQ